MALVVDCSPSPNKNSRVPKLALRPADDDEAKSPSSPKGVYCRSTRSFTAQLWSPRLQGKLACRATQDGRHTSVFHAARPRSPARRDVVSAPREFPPSESNALAPHASKLQRFGTTLIAPFQSQTLWHRTLPDSSAPRRPRLRTWRSFAQSWGALGAPLARAAGAHLPAGHHPR